MSNNFRYEPPKKNTASRSPYSSPKKRKTFRLPFKFPGKRTKTSRSTYKPPMQHTTSRSTYKPPVQHTSSSYFGTSESQPVSRSPYSYNNPYNRNKSKKPRRKIRVSFLTVLSVLVILVNIFIYFNNSSKEKSEFDYEYETTDISQWEQNIGQNEEQNNEQNDEQNKSENHTKTIYDEGDRALWYNYCRLDDEEKQYYIIAYNSMINGETRFSFNCSVKYDIESEIRKIAYAVLNDHPEIFWINGYSYSYLDNMFLSSSQKCTVYIDNFDFWNLSFNKEEMKEELNREVDKVAEQALQSGGAFEQVKYVHDYLVNKITYDHEATKYTTEESIQDGFCYARSAYGALVKNSVVCAGYAKGFQIIMNRLGYNCAYICGDTPLGYHAWNLIKLDNEYYWMDVTWDDVDSEDEIDVVYYNYFCVSDEILYRTHTPDIVPSVPICDSTEYEYYHTMGLYIDDYSLNKLTNALNKQKGNQYLTVRLSDINQIYEAKKDFREALINADIYWNNYYIICYSDECTIWAYQ